MVLISPLTNGAMKQHTISLLKYGQYKVAFIDKETFSKDNSIQFDSRVRRINKGSGFKKVLWSISILQAFRMFQLIKKIESKSPESAQFIKDNFTWGHFADHVTPWEDDPEFLRQVEEWLPGVNRLYFTGGEPTIIERVYWIMEKCVEMGIAKDIDLVFNSNMTNVQKRFINLVEQFKSVLMCVSVDAYGSENEYIRGASHWKQVDKNIRKYCESDVVGTVNFSPVIQIYNVLTITKLLDYCEELEKEYGREIFVTFLICDYPTSLDFRNCPDQVREVAIGRLEQWLQRSEILAKRDINIQTVTATINALKERRHANWRQELATFQKYTELLDNNRDESMEEAFPELFNLMYKSNR